ncbi:hypothetical protein [Streptomyces sp. NPDC001792]|uniref:hypothetical protein n=1 Tax=unclassified Streptomyces TaxID=2593676 RepID=UPI003331D465
MCERHGQESTPALYTLAHPEPAPAPVAADAPAGVSVLEPSALVTARVDAQDALRAYTESAQAGRPLSARALDEAFGTSESYARKQILAVHDDEPSRRVLRAVATAAV